MADKKKSSTGELRDSARWIGECAAALLRAIDPPGTSWDWGWNPGVSGALHAIEMAVRSTRELSGTAATSGEPPTPDRVWLFDGKAGVIHGTKMLWGERKTCCGHGQGVKEVYRLGSPAEVTCRGNGCRTVGP